MSSEKEFKKDSRSIEELCGATWEPIYRFIYYKVQNREETEDIIQETYVKAITYLQKKGKKPDEYIGFLKTVSLNIIRDRWRKNKRRGKDINLELADPLKTALDDPSDAVTQQTVISEALNELGEEQRRVIELRILQGYSAAETAKIMGKSEVNIRVIQYRALKTLAGILKNSGCMKEE